MPDKNSQGWLAGGLLDFRGIGGEFAFGGQKSPGRFDSLIDSRTVVNQQTDWPGQNCSSEMGLSEVVVN